MKNTFILLLFLMGSLSACGSIPDSIIAPNDSVKVSTVVVKDGKGYEIIERTVYQDSTTQVNSRRVKNKNQALLVIRVKLGEIQSQKQAVREQKKISMQTRKEYRENEKNMDIYMDTLKQKEADLKAERDRLKGEG